MVSFIIPVKNDAVRLNRCLRSIARAAGSRSVETIVVDNGSIDDSAACARQAGAAVLAVPDGRVARLRNAGASSARGEFLAFVDADHEIGDNWLIGALETMEPADVGAAGALYSAPPDGNWVQRMYGALRGRTVGRSETRWLGSGNLIVRRDVFSALCGFDESLESCEDVDFCERLRHAGWRLLAEERLLSIHHGDPPSLAKLFHAERWRGRDNLRITYRHGLTMRDLPSVLAPLLIVTAMGLAVAAAVALPFARVAAPVLALTIGTILLLCGLRGVRVAASGCVCSVSAFLQALAVGTTYELARAAAVISRASHHRERHAHQSGGTSV